MGSLFKRKNHPTSVKPAEEKEKEDSTRSGSGNSKADKFSPGENMMVKPKIIMFPDTSVIDDIDLREDDSQDDWDNGNVYFDETSYGTPSSRKKELLRHKRSAIESWVSDRKNGSSRSLQCYLDEDPEEEDAAAAADDDALPPPKAGLRGLRRSQSARKLAELDHLGTPLDSEQQRIEMNNTIEKLQREKKELNDRMAGNRLQPDSILAMKDETTHRRTEQLKESEEQKFHKSQLAETREFYAVRLQAAEDEVKSLRTAHENALKRIAELEAKNASLTAKLQKKQDGEGSEALDPIQSRGSRLSRSKSPISLRRSRSRDTDSSTERKRSTSRAKRKGKGALDRSGGGYGSDRDLDRSDRDISKGDLKNHNRQLRKSKAYNMKETEKNQDLNKNGGEIRSPRHHKFKLSRGYGSDRDLSQENRRARNTRLRRSASAEKDLTLRRSAGAEKDLTRGYGSDKDLNDRERRLSRNSKLQRSVTTGSDRDLTRSSKLFEELNISSSSMCSILDEDLAASNRLVEELNLSTTALQNWYNGNGIA